MDGQAGGCEATLGALAWCTCYRAHLHHYPKLSPEHHSPPGVSFRAPRLPKKSHFSLLTHWHSHHSCSSARWRGCLQPQHHRRAWTYTQEHRSSTDHPLTNHRLTTDQPLSLSHPPRQVLDQDRLRPLPQHRAARGWQRHCEPRLYAAALQQPKSNPAVAVRSALCSLPKS